jgi:hypothetical protein
MSVRNWLTPTLTLTQAVQKTLADDLKKENGLK